MERPAKEGKGMIYIVSAILVLEVVRLIFALIDSHRVKIRNKAAMDRAVEWEAEYQALRQAEIDSLKEMAKEAGRMAQIVDDLKASVK